MAENSKRKSLLKSKKVEGLGLKVEVKPLVPSSSTANNNNNSSSSSSKDAVSTSSTNINSNSNSNSNNDNGSISSRSNDSISSGYSSSGSDSTPCTTPSSATNFEGIKIGKDGLVSYQGEYKWEDLRVVKPIGSGATASVKKVKHIPSGTTWALKVMQTDGDLIKPKVIAAEVRTLYGHNCPNLIGFQNVFNRDGAIYLLLEFMDYGSLQDLLDKYVLNKKKKLPEEVIGNIALQSLMGLMYLHEERKTIHRDIKPANILLNSKGEVKITDFGMAGNATNTLAQMETFQGTLVYMSPERIIGQLHSFNSDIWSLGLSLVQCMLGTFPYKCIPKQPQPGEGEQSAGFFELLDEITKQEKLPLPDDIGSDELKDFIWSCMKNDPAVRPSAKELLSHPFIKKYQSKPIDLGAWLKKHLPRKKKSASMGEQQ